MSYAPAVPATPVTKRLIVFVVGLAMIAGMMLAVRHTAAAAGCGINNTDQISIKLAPPANTTAALVDQAARAIVPGTVLVNDPLKGDPRGTLQYGSGSLVLKLSTPVQGCLELAGTNTKTLPKKWAQLIGLIVGVVSRILVTATVMAIPGGPPFALPTGNAFGFFFGTLVGSGLETGDWKAATVDALWAALLAAIGGVAVRLIWPEADVACAAASARLKDIVLGWLFAPLRWATNAVANIMGRMAIEMQAFPVPPAAPKR